MERLEIVPANPDVLVIVRLFLEKLELLTPEERRAFGQLIEMLASPMVQCISDEVTSR